MNKNQLQERIDYQVQILNELRILCNIPEKEDIVEFMRNFMVQYKKGKETRVIPAPKQQVKFMITIQEIR